MGVIAHCIRVWALTRCGLNYSKTNWSQSKNEEVPVSGNVWKCASSVAGLDLKYSSGERNNSNLLTEGQKGGANSEK